MKIFPTAEQARKGSRNNVRIHAEIRHIENAILAAIDTGGLSVTVNTSYMTLAGTDEDPGTGRAYYEAWMAGDGTGDRALIDQMTNVLIHFKDLGYSIIRKVTGTDPVTFQWEIMW